MIVNELQELVKVKRDVALANGALSNMTPEFKLIRLLMVLIGRRLHDLFTMKAFSPTLVKHNVVDPIPGRSPKFREIYRLPQKFKSQYQLTTNL